jgi:hypothetical protein
MRSTSRRASASVAAAGRVAWGGRCARSSRCCPCPWRSYVHSGRPSRADTRDRRAHPTVQLGLRSPGITQRNQRGAGNRRGRVHSPGPAGYIRPRSGARRAAWGSTPWHSAAQHGTQVTEHGTRLTTACRSAMMRAGKGNSTLARTLDSLVLPPPPPPLRARHQPQAS